MDKQDAHFKSNIFYVALAKFIMNANVLPQIFAGFGATIMPLLAESHTPQNRLSKTFEPHMALAPLIST